MLTLVVNPIAGNGLAQRTHDWKAAASNTALS